MLRNTSAPRTGVGLRRRSVVLSPNSPNRLRPQQKARPAVVTPQVCTIPLLTCQNAGVSAAKASAVSGATGVGALGLSPHAAATRLTPSTGIHRPSQRER